MSKPSELSMTQLHNITHSAKISCALISIFLTDLDGGQEHSSSAKEWLYSEHEGPASVLNCTRHLANLNAYLHNYGLDVAPTSSADSWHVSSNDEVSLGDDLLLPASSAEWLSAIEKWASDQSSPEERAAVAQQLIEVVDHQVQACYAHAREVSQGFHHQMRRESDLVNENPNEPLLLAPEQGPM